MSDLSDMLDQAYEAFDGSEALETYMRRHGVESLGILTITDDERAHLVTEYLRERISGKVVVELGAGIGLLAMHMAEYAKHVYAIEASPIWASSFAVSLLKRKPKNMTFILGAASEMEGILHADIAVFCSHSGIASMQAASAKFAPVVVDIYRDVLADTTDPQTVEMLQYRNQP